MRRTFRKHQTGLGGEVMDERFLRRVHRVVGGGIERDRPEELALVSHLGGVPAELLGDGVGGERTNDWLVRITRPARFGPHDTACS